MPDDGANSDDFGYDVSISGYTAIVGARLDDNKGSAYLFGPIYYADADGDGFGSLIDSVIYENGLEGYVANSTDCNDNDKDIFPGAFEIADNGIDENCDCNDLTTYYLDADGDVTMTATSTVTTAGGDATLTAGVNIDLFVRRLWPFSA